MLSIYHLCLPLPNLSLSDIFYISYHIVWKGVDQGCDGFYLESINHQLGNREGDQNEKKQESQVASNAGRDGSIR